MASLHDPVPGQTPRARRWLSAAAVLVIALAGGGLVGCESTERSASAGELGPPPDGYETWDDYYREQDADARKLEHDAAVQQMKQPRVPGAPG
ncbi:MAG: hypothetical protein ACYTGG_09680 [Planctomycetota bacterium]|jgi:hypothetical protein